MRKSRAVLQLKVSSLSPSASRGMLTVGLLRFACALGRSGQRALKREGDGATPPGEFELQHVFYRADRIMRPTTRLPLRALRSNDGWCDAAGDRNYNRHVVHPYPASAERMWREDELYDVLVVISHNQRPRVRGHGSAVFIHIAREGYTPTEGCIALRRADLLRLLGWLRPGDRIVVGRS